MTTKVCERQRRTIHMHIHTCANGHVEAVDNHRRHHSQPDNHDGYDPTLMMGTDPTLMMGRLSTTNMTTTQLPTPLVSSEVQQAHANLCITTRSTR